MFVNLDWPLNASRSLSAITEVFFVMISLANVYARLRELYYSHAHAQAYSAGKHLISLSLVWDNDSCIEPPHALDAAINFVKYWQDYFYGAALGLGLDLGSAVFDKMKAALYSFSRVLALEGWRESSLLSLVTFVKVTGAFSGQRKNGIPPSAWNVMLWHCCELEGRVG